ncbi:probable cytochrome P450 304a1 [Schistocerca piceifrons]|uniref:probable cytochrome P450 304a1 n=1 Tax=Schistocerca piceifrons TaxID=274613 RepID=UPI001F5F28F1|nr:probable cytochrome P450 304a1 [Schistocerca piceifrons]
MVLFAVVLAALALGLFLSLLWAECSKPANFPPGPAWRLPVWGNYLQLLLENFKFPYRALNAMARRYHTKLLGFYFGPYPTVVACDYDAVKEVLANPHIQGRASNVAIRDRAYGKDLGVFFVDGELWKEQRRFSLRYLRDFGFGRRSKQLEAEIEAEVKDLLEMIRGEREGEGVVRACPASGGRRLLLPEALFTATSNCLLPALYGGRAPREADAATRALGRAGLGFLRSTDATGGFVTLHPWLAALCPRLSGYLDTVHNSDHFRFRCEQMVDEHKNTLCDDDMRDFIDVYLKEMMKKQKTEEPTFFSTEQLVVTMMDFLIPTTTSLAVALTWYLMCVAHHPRVLRRIHQELDSVVGRGRLPSLDDRPRTPYFEASIRESLRLCTLTPISIPHRATQDTTLKGYFIPANTIVITSLWSVHMDENLWGDPNNYRPERFLENDGTLTKKDYTLPFGAGKRLCPGETFSRQNFYLLCGALLQNFTIEPDGVPPLDSNIPGFVETQPSFWARFTPR